MKKLTKVLSILLAVALVCTGLLLAVSADEAVNETASYMVDGQETTGTLVEALTAADESTTVTLMGDCTLEETFTVTKSVTVDLNGYKLTAKADAFAIGENGVQFTITGTGSINLAAKLVSAAAEYDGFTVEVAGTDNTEGIAISHSASNVITTYHGYWNFKNLKVVTSSPLKGGYKSGDTLIDAESYFKTVCDDSATAEIYFYNVNVDATAAPYSGSTGNFIVSIAGSGSVAIDHSIFRTQNSGIYAGNELGRTPLSGSIRVTYSTISCLAASTATSRNYVILGMDSNFATGIDNAPYGFNGTLNIEYSTVECNTRLFCMGSKDEPSVNIHSSTMRIAGNYGKDTAYSIYRGVGSIGISGETRYISVNGNLSNAPIGTRANLEAYVKNNLDASKKVVYDPFGDPEAPYLVVAADDAMASPDFSKDFGFDTISFTKNYSASTHNGNRDINVNKTSTGTWTSKDPYWHDATSKGGMQWDNKLGTITHIQNEQGNYVKWWLQPDPENPTATTRKLSGSTKTDTYLIMGLDSAGNKTVSGHHPTALSGEYRKAVVVAEFEFATEKDGIGYPYMNIVAQTRNNLTKTKDDGTIVEDNGSENNKTPVERTFAINNAGQITGTDKLNDAPAVMPTLNPNGEWNRISMVCYSDPANAMYSVHVYLNGEYMGWVNLTDGNTAGDYVYFQGIRVNFSNDNQKVNSNLLIDNVSVRAYTNYQVDGEADGGAKYPEQYIIGTPANKYVDAPFEVGGRTFEDVNEALVYAASINSIVNVKSDVAVEVTENGYINTNGYSFSAVGDSYGYVANGNIVEFNENYQYTAYFFNSDPNKLNAGYVFDAADFETVIVKGGSTLDRDMTLSGYAFKNFADKTIAGSQNGWSTLVGQTVSMLPMTVTADVLASKDENNAIYYYPTFSEDVIPMTYYVTNAAGETYAGDITNEQALVDFQALKGGDTFVLQANVNISKAGTIFANNVDTTEQVINIDLNGYTLSLSEAGIFFNVGSYTTLNVYSSVAGGAVNCVTNVGGTLKGNTAFVINDPAVSSYTSPELTENVKSAKINLGQNGVKMTVIAEVALQGRIGDDDCRIVSDGVDFYSPTNLFKGNALIDTKLFNGEIYVKNGLLVNLVKDNIVNLNGFYNTEDVKDGEGKKISTAHKPDVDAEGNEIELSNRQTNFENTIITSYVEIENCILVNNPAGFNNNSVKDNIVGNNGDGNNTRKNLLFKNVVSTGRLNPSNSNRTAFEGFVAIEWFDVSSKNDAMQNGTAIGNYVAPMTLDAWNLGLELDGGVLTIDVNYYDVATGEFVDALDYKLANTGVAVEGENAYTLPMFAKGTAYEADLVNVNWKNIKGDADVTSITYIKGSKFTEKTGVKAPAYTEGFVTLTHDGTWSDAPEYVTENVDRIPGYTGNVTAKCLKANVSLFVDFDLNLYIPAEYAEFVTVNGYELTDVVVNGVAYKMFTVTQACNEITKDITVTFEVTQTVFGTEYTGTATLTYSVAKYAANVLASKTNTDADKVLVYYIVKYANAATAYINGAADATLEALVANNASFGELYADADGFANAVEDTKLSDVFTSATVTLDPKPAFVLTVKAGFVGTVTVKYADGTNVRVYNIDANTMRDIVVEGMKAYNFTQVLEITAEGTVNGEAVSITEGAYTLDTFAKYHNDNAANADSAACLDLVNALCDYAEVAKLYMAGTLAQ